MEMVLSQVLSSFEEKFGVSRDSLEIEVRVDSSIVQILISLRRQSGMEKAVEDWISNWRSSQAAFGGGVLSPGSAFSGVLLDESDFLARPDGVTLGADQVIAQSILVAHGGSLQILDQSERFGVRLEVPALNSLNALRTLLESRLEKVGGDDPRVNGILLCCRPRSSGASFFAEVDWLTSKKIALGRKVQLSIPDLGSDFLVADLQGDLVQARAELREGLRDRSLILLIDESLSVDRALQLSQEYLRSAHGHFAPPNA
jgi:hypothetical protein